MKKSILLGLSVILSGLQLAAQDTFPFNGVRPKDVTSAAFTHATIYVDHVTRLEDATLIIKMGKVVAVGKGLAIPEDAVVMDLTGQFIYPSFIDIYSDYGIPKVTPKERSGPGRPQLDTDRKGAFGWNQAIRSDTRAAELFEPNEDAAKELRGIGIGTVVSHQMDGIARGTSCLVTMGTNPTWSLLRAEASAHYSFSKGSSTQQYPSSLMGSIALLRQTHYDAQWYAEGGMKAERNLTLDAWIKQQALPQVFEAGDKWNALRADRIGDEFKVQYIFRGGGNEYQRISELKATGGAFILPLEFPAAWNVSDPYTARLVSLDEMKHWEMAPHNPRLLHEAGIPMAFTTHGLNERKQLWAALRKVKETGLNETEILKAFTTTPATWMKAEKEIGALREGMWANFFTTSLSIFDESATLLEHYVQGERFEVNAPQMKSIAGIYSLKMDGTTSQLTVKGEPNKYLVLVETLVQHRGEIEPNDDAQKLGSKMDTLVRKGTLEQNGGLLTMMIESDSARVYTRLRLTGTAEEGVFNGRGQRADGTWFDWSASFEKPSEEKKKKNDANASKQEEVGQLIYPFVAYGQTAPPKQETIHFIHATLWTCEEEGVIEDGEVLIHQGKIVAVGKNLSAAKYPGAVVIDAKGKHISPGIIDEHSHIALNSVNEGTHASSAEVQESTVVDPEDINIYRQLSGGVTAAQLLHGSANPIGGQSALIKFRWGATDRGMLIDGADGFIKFALGENVKQSNWGDGNRVRYPQTRMGVEQVYYDHFIRAREYGAQWSAWKSSSKPAKGKPAQAGPAPRRDLELDALLEILEKKRFVTCHSYQQSEINMLMHVADSMGFRINTFTHILEGYKVADKMKAHGVGASSFSDWWAYKVEVKDAIPYNGALLWENGITVAYNSDDAEMARRLNQEAAKAVKYGGVPEMEALKFVTLNPAKLLHLDHRMGSLKAGKDADLVMWSDHPLSIYAKAEMTFVDGIRYYDAEKDKQMRVEMEKERARLTEKMIAVKSSGGTTREPSMKSRTHFHCDTLGDR